MILVAVHLRSGTHTNTSSNLTCLHSWSLTSAKHGGAVGRKQYCSHYVSVNAAGLRLGLELVGSESLGLGLGLRLALGCAEVVY